MAASEAQLLHSKEALKESEKQLEKSRLDQLKRLKTKLLETQAGRIKHALEQGEKVKHQLSKHAQLLQSEIEQGRVIVHLDDGQNVDLRDELRTILGYLAQLELESVFPRCMQTKLRFAAPEEDGFVGVRDFDVEAFGESLFNSFNSFIW